MSIRPLFMQYDQSFASRSSLPHSADPNAVPHLRSRVEAKSDSRGRVGWTLWMMILVLAFGALIVSRASGQQGNFPYESIPMPARLQEDAVVRQVEASAKSYAMTGSGDARLAQGYFSIYVPAKMTAPDGVKHISGLVDQMTSLISRAQRANRPQLAQQLTGFIFEGMKKVAEGNYHPAARINAVLMLTRLDRQPANQAARTPPIPLLQTLPIMIALYEDANLADGIRAAALQGIHRHVTLGFPQITPQDQTKITGLMTALLDAPPTQGRSAKAHAYLQRFAVDILDVLRAKEDTSLGTKLVSISTEPNNPDLIALYSASRLATMGTELQGQIQAPEKVLNSWSLRVLAAFESELERLDDYLVRPQSAREQPVKPESFLEKKATETAANSRSGTMDMDMDMDMDMEMGYDMSAMMPDMSDMDMDMDMDMGDMMGMMMGMGGAVVAEKPQPPEVIATRQRLNNVLQQVHLGVTGQPVAGLPGTPGGLLASVPADQKKVVEDWVTEMEAVIAVLNDKTLDDFKKFRTGLAEQTEALRDLAGVEREAADLDPAIPDDLVPVDPLADLAPVAPENNVPSELVAP